ncbi:MAG: SRPBCC domain-containing protein [Capsulimonas sp.]|jgi:uncharacterized protein YndB with AHSA1/START domain|uniref:SRPBCC domain-containing protein n=1 Tax=Capsulimonas sp. TaxID=2494211 RepID=UPI00326337BA
MITTVQDTIEREITVRASKERVFNAIVDPNQIVAWFPDTVQGKIEVGERPVFTFGEKEIQLYVRTIDPHDYVAYNWVPCGSEAPDGFLGDVLAEPHTLVEFRLTEVPGGTLVKVKESGFASLPALTAEKTLGDNTDGWAYMMGRLETLMSQE